ncbi:MAG: hypothetical protein WBQ60_06115 [Asticcacaulis sp.]
MRRIYLMNVSALMGLICLASPALAQFAPDTTQSTTPAQDSASTYYDTGSATTDTTPTYYDTSSATTDTTGYSYSDPAVPALPSQPLSQRSVGEVAGAMLGEKKAKKALDAERVMRAVTGHDDSAVTDTGEPDDVVPVLRGIMGLINKKKAAQ